MFTAVRGIILASSLPCLLHALPIKDGHAEEQATQIKANGELLVSTATGRHAPESSLITTGAAKGNDLFTPEADSGPAVDMISGLRDPYEPARLPPGHPSLQATNLLLRREDLAPSQAGASASMDELAAVNRPSLSEIESDSEIKMFEASVGATTKYNSLQPDDEDDSIVVESEEGGNETESDDNATAIGGEEEGMKTSDCQDTEMKEGSTSKYSCAQIKDDTGCYHSDEEFTALEMCCFCGGGIGGVDKEAEKEKEEHEVEEIVREMTGFAPGPHGMNPNPYAQAYHDTLSNFAPVSGGPVAYNDYMPSGSAYGASYDVYGNQMAESKKDDDDSSFLIIILIVLAVIMSAGVGAYFYMYRKGGDDDENGYDEVEEEANEEAAAEEPAADNAPAS